MKNWMDREERLLFLGLKPHSKGEDLLINKILDWLNFIVQIIKIIKVKSKIKIILFYFLINWKLIILDILIK